MHDNAKLTVCAMFKRRKPQAGHTGDNPLASRVVRGDDRPTEPLPAETKAPERAPGEGYRSAQATRNLSPAPPDHDRRREEPATRLVSPPDGLHGAAAAGEELPVAVLLVARGPGRGSLLPVGSGANELGRGVDARIRLDFGDEGIVPERHAVLTHDPGRRRFTLQPGDGVEPVTLDGQPVLEPLVLRDGARLRLGATELLFRILCDSHDDASGPG